MKTGFSETRPGTKETCWGEIRLASPGESFADSFLLGNGAFGASLGFQPGRETVLLSHTAFWSGAPARSHGRPGAPAAFRRARALSLRGEHAAAWEALEDFIGEKENYGTGLPVGRLIAEQALAGAAEYTRVLEMGEGIARCAFRHAGGRQRRQARCTERPEMLEYVFRDSSPMRISFSLEGVCLTARKAEGDLFLFEAEARETVHSDGTCGVRLAGGFRLWADGRVSAEPERLTAEGREIRLRLTMETDFDLVSADCLRPGGLDAAREIVRRRLTEIPEDLPPGIPLQPRVEIAGEDRINRQAFLGHYLLRAAATPESPLPPHLQGVWNDEEACRLGWSCDYHLDVNTQMNLWCAETLGEGERLAPLFRFMLSRLIPEGRQTARGYYGLPGAAAELSANCFGYAAPYWGRPLAPCPACGWWLCEIVIRHALNHPEMIDFQEETALPILRPYVEFLLAYVTEDGAGRRTGGPSVSPENGFVSEDGRTVYASMGAAFENEQMRILLEGYVRICERACPGEEMAQRAREMLERLPGPRIGSGGEIREYAHDLPASVPHHRHMSHLTGLYPGRSITPETKELAAAAERSIRERIQPGEEFESTPWARIMLALYEARLGHGEEALSHLERAMADHGSPSLLLMHPSIPGTMNPRPVWEMDGNTGFTEAVLEMLVQGSEALLRLLPALPEKWKRGRISGIQAGPWRVEDMRWEMPGRIRARLRGEPGRQLDILWQGRRMTRVMPETGEMTLTAEDWKE